MVWLTRLAGEASLLFLPHQTQTRVRASYWAQPPDSPIPPSIPPYGTHESLWEESQQVYSHHVNVNILT